MQIYLVYLLIDSHFTHGYNYGIGYIASVLKHAGYKVKYIPIWNQQDLIKLYDDIINDQPEIIAFSATSSQFPHLKAITKSIKKISDAYLVCGGTHPTLNPESLSEISDLDAIIIGEGEYPLLELADSIKNKLCKSDIKSIWFKSENGIIKNSVRPLIENLNSLPFPDKDSLDYQNVIDISKGTNRFIFSRGCTFKCSYCSNHALSDIYPNKKNYYRYLDPEIAIEQIREDHKKYKFDYIIFDDDTISLNKKWFFKFFELYKKNFNYPFRCNLRVETVNEEVVKVLKEANAKNIGIGLEHGNEEFRKNVLNRHMSNDDIKEVFALCDKYEITHEDFLMIGFPNETRKLFFDTVKLSREVSANGRPSIFQPYPATALAEICESNNWMPDKEIFKERRESVIDFPTFKKDDIQLCADLFRFLNRYKSIPLIDLRTYMVFLLYIHKVEARVRRYSRQFITTAKYFLLGLFFR